ncbi:MAG TPA: hypothetical protein VE689_08520 [Candidatus Udaeobacter sp.]|jgi:hypothetical protein|nr:hypothetical protein [Candidatus Udaeobacter sp.]
MKISGIFSATALLLVLSGPAVSQTTTDLNTEAARMNTLGAGQGESKVIGKISGEFSSFLGSNSNTVVSGLRNGTPITLTTTTLTPSSTPGAPAVPTTTTTTISPPTGKMGFGNVFISLALAKQQLGQLGITQPTPEQLQAALTGGTITTNTGTTAAGTTSTSTNLQGILTMRSQNMGWGQIAQRLGFKLGPVVSGLKNANHSMTTASTSSTSSGTTTADGQVKGKSETGIVSGNGKLHGSSGHGVAEKSGSGEGIVSASGRSVGNGNAYGKGIVTGSGHGNSGSSGITTGSSHGNSAGHGNGRDK